MPGAQPRSQRVILIIATISKMLSHARHFRRQSLILIRNHPEKAVLLFFRDKEPEAQRG